MVPQRPSHTPEHQDPARQQSRRSWRRRNTLTGVAIAAAFALAGIATRGDAQQITAAQSAAPSAGHAQVIAQAVVDLPDGPIAWSMTTVEADARQTGLATNGVPGFALGTDGDVIIRAGANDLTRLAGGEALAVRPNDTLTVRAEGASSAGLSLLALSPADPAGLNDPIPTSEVFASPGGSRDIELIGDALAEGESAEIPATAAPIFVLVTEGSLAIAGDDDETRVVPAGETALISGDLFATGEAAEPTRFVAAVIGGEVDAAS